MSEPLRATFFALQPRKGGILFGATICYVLMFAALTAALLFPLFAVMGFDLQGVASGAPPATAATPDPMKAIWIVPLGLIAVFAFCVLTASFEAACLRWMIRGEKPGLFGLALDEDTWRVYGIYWVWWLYYVVAWIGFLILSALISRLLPENQIAWWIGAGLYTCAIALGAVALAPAAAVTVGQRRFAFGDAFQATEDHFGALLASFAVLLGLQHLLNYGLTAVWAVWALDDDALTRFAGANDWMSLSMAYNATIAAAMSEPGAAPVYWAITASSVVASFAISVLIYGVNARVTRLWMQQQGQVTAAPAAA